MSQYRRLFAPGGSYFFTVNLEDRSSTALVDHIHELREAWAYVQARHPFTNVAAVVLPDHLHCIWELPPGDQNYPTRWRLLKSHFSRALAKTGMAGPGRRYGERDLWQRRYWEHMIRDDADLQRHVDYVHRNPVKHGLARSLTDWEFSTFNYWDPNPQIARQLRRVD
jgi:putative transposase